MARDYFCKQRRCKIKTAKYNLSNGCTFDKMEVDVEERILGVEKKESFYQRILRLGKSALKAWLKAKFKGWFEAFRAWFN